MHPMRHDLDLGGREGLVHRMGEAGGPQAKAARAAPVDAVAVRTYCRACALTHDVHAHTDREAMLLEAEHAQAAGDAVTAAVWRARAASTARPAVTGLDREPLLRRAR